MAALHLHLPELADQIAATRILKADALLKVTASFDPLKHPRWPKGSQDEHGGEFRPASDESQGEETEPEDSEETQLDPQPDGSKVLIHHHHWHDRAITRDYQRRGLLTPEASS